jgi:hypothetical protein
MNTQPTDNNQAIDPVQPTDDAAIEALARDKAEDTIGETLEQTQKLAVRVMCYFDGDSCD